MTELNIPATEAVVGEAREPLSYELAFHVLPTVAEGEVSAVFDRIKAHITNLGGIITEEEAPARFDLAYDIVKFLEGRNRKFSSAYFGWVRFSLGTERIDELSHMMGGAKEILRYLLVRLSKTEHEHPFYFHPAIATRVVETIDVDAEGVVEDAVEEAGADVVEEKTGDGEAATEEV